MAAAVSYTHLDVYKRQVGGVRVELCQHLDDGFFHQLVFIHLVPIKVGAGKLCHLQFAQGFIEMCIRDRDNAIIYASHLRGFHLPARKCEENIIIFLLKGEVLGTAPTRQRSCKFGTAGLPFTAVLSAR